MVSLKKVKAFTLIELLVVVAIIGILAAVGVVAYNGYTSSAKVAAVKNMHSKVVKFIASETKKCSIGAELILKKNLRDILMIFVHNMQTQLALIVMQQYLHIIFFSISVMVKDGEMSTIILLWLIVVLSQIKKGSYAFILKKTSMVTIIL